MIFFFLFLGDCLADKLKLALRLVLTEIEHLEEKIESFEYCKFQLQNILKRPGQLRGRALNRYTTCTLNIECKLNQWLEALKYRKHDITYDLKQLGSGWVPYIKKCRFLCFHKYRYLKILKKQ